MYVLAFDQDWTVDVNPHPHRDAVPLTVSLSTSSGEVPIEYPLSDLGPN